MLAELRAKVISAFMTVGFAGALLANPAAASAASGCNDFHEVINGDLTVIATLCRSWEPSSAGGYNGHYWASYYLNSQVVGWAVIDGKGKRMPPLGQSENYYEKRDVRQQACYKTCSRLK